jgi:P-type Ca2+ transporter type 2C
VPLLPSSVTLADTDGRDMTTDSPAAVADAHGPDLPARHATAGSITAMPSAEVFGALESSPQGLTVARAASRLADLGPNELRAAKGAPAIRKVLAQFTNLFALVLLAASVITFASYLIQSPRDTGNLELAVAILAVVLLNGAIGFFQEYSAEKTSQALQALVPHTARVRRDGTLADIAARDVVTGDVFVLEAGDDICCDGRLVEAHDLTVDDVALTGESAPVRRTADPAPAGTATMDAANLVFMGTSVVEGTATAVALATGADTQFGQIYQMTARVADVASPLRTRASSPSASSPTAGSFSPGHSASPSSAASATSPPCRASSAPPASPYGTGSCSSASASRCS